MLLRTLREKFRETLSGIYSEKETDSLFYVVAEEFLKLSKAEVVLNLEKEFPEKQVAKMETALRKLQQEFPVQYIVNTTEFYGLDLYVDPSVLIPRPETEELVTWIVGDYQNSSPYILDIGTGSGCIAIALSKEIRGSRVSALDISQNALQVAGKNAKLNKTEVTFFHQDILNCESLPQKYDVIVSNPPYVRESEKKLMQKNVLDYEPHSALFVPDDEPLLFYKKIIILAQKSLNPGGCLYLEINEALGTDMVKLFQEHAFDEIILKKDIFGKERMIKGKL